MEEAQDVLVECDAVIFDLDGVLIDSSAVIERHWRAWAKKHGLDLDMVMRHAHGRRTIETMQIAAPGLDVEAEARLYEQMEAEDVDGVKAIAGADVLLQSLPVDSWAIATSGTRPLATARLKHAGLPVPRTFITADDVLHGKPHPEPYLAAMRGLSMTAGRCLVFEDAPAGLQAAHAAGMRAVAVASTHPAAELGLSVLVAERLSDIKVYPGSESRLIVWVGMGLKAGAEIR